MRQQKIFILVGIVLVVGCLVAGAVYWGTGPSLRCELSATGWSARTVVSGGRARCYHLYVPPGYDPARPGPLVLSLHGFLSNPDSQAWIGGWDELAGREGFLVAYPQGTSWPQRWNAGATWNAGVDDVRFLRDLIDDLDSVAAVDRARVYVSGFSNGGGMALRFACEAAGEVAALGTVAAAVVGLEDCAPARPVPVLAFHGTADPVVPYEGGEMRNGPVRQGALVTRAPTYFVGAEAWTAFWAAGSGCQASPEVIPPQGDVRGVRYTGCDQDAEVILYTIEEGGHTWPGGTPLLVVGKTSRDIDATEEMWRFFQGYRLPALGEQ